MRDIGITWDTVAAEGDWTTPDQDAAYAAQEAAGTVVDGDLVSAVLVSLLTDRRASTDYAATTGDNDRRGWWADAYEPEPIGSRLWQLVRLKKVPATLLRARDFAGEALAWLIRDGIASRVDVQTFWAGRAALGIGVRITLTNGPAVAVSTSVPFGLLA